MQSHVQVHTSFWVAYHTRACDYGTWCAHSAGVMQHVCDVHVKCAETRVYPTCGREWVTVVHHEDV